MGNIDFRNYFSLYLFTFLMREKMENVRKKSLTHHQFLQYTSEEGAKNNSADFLEKTDVEAIIEKLSTIANIIHTFSIICLRRIL